MKRFALVLVVAVYLALVVHGAAELSFLPDNAIGNALHWGSRMSGADGTFKFYSPSVSPQHRAHFTLSDEDGNTWTDTLEGDATGEAQMRLGCSPESLFPFEESEWPEDFDEILMSSWAKAILARHPDATEVVVQLQIYDVPSLAEYRAGGRPEWESIYQMTFTRDELE